MAKVKIVLSDTFVLFREGVHFVISGEENLDVIGETNDNKSVHDFLAINPADIVFIGINGDWQKDLSIVCHIKRNFPSVSVISILNEYDVDKIVTAISSDISAYITRSGNEQDLLDVITKISHGVVPITNTMLTPEIATAILKDFNWISKLRGDLKGYVMEISPIETEILTRISSEMDIRKVAVALNSSEDDIRYHLESIRKKLVANYISKLLIDTMQQDVFIDDSTKQEKPPIEYVTREEFLEFKETLKKLLTNSISIIKDF